MMGYYYGGKVEAAGSVAGVPADIPPINTSI